MQEGRVNSLSLLGMIDNRVMYEISSGFMSCYSLHFSRLFPKKNLCLKVWTLSDKRKLNYLYDLERNFAFETCISLHWAD